jgi:hypothetical protein
MGGLQYTLISKNMSKYSIKDFKIGEEVLIKHSVLNKVEHESRGIIADISSKKLKSGIIALKMGESKYMREIPIIYINDVQAIVKVKDKKLDKYEKLTLDLKEAKEAAIEFVESIRDGGTANLDSTFLILKRWNEEKVVEAIKKAGLLSEGKRNWIGTGYFISINTGQANKRTVARNHFMFALKSKGYQVISFDKMD